jgi:hypothetical protein
VCARASTFLAKTGPALKRRQSTQSSPKKKTENEKIKKLTWPNRARTEKAPFIMVMAEKKRDPKRSCVEVWLFPGEIKKKKKSSQEPWHIYPIKSRYIDF